MAKSIVDRPPSQALRFGLRLPIWLYRLHLGWLLGNRFLMLTHKGRKSGQPYRTVIEVVQFDKETDTYYAVSGWGNKADWYQNIHAYPEVVINVGRRKLKGHAIDIPLPEAIDILDKYTRQHPLAFKELTRLFLGEQLQPGRDASRRLAELMPMVAFQPMTSFSALG
jgi:deazaflavin-dependent oxidoreductase (nitroreductase family)